MIMKAPVKSNATVKHFAETKRITVKIIIFHSYPQAV